ncbi:S-adenosyl-L-methionine-dependent methyltransferase [Endogone sp. FLAS-F59071]|nr:S-adenosyl-L-methionine-dependent methyltransferase [Endogone sp. FLAS-F59071]|eukprot:RUS17578.1 S-adenosyl-L-methionine-dependent methyltransferase [Endogone sp. FLAS-F59071]
MSLWTLRLLRPAPRILSSTFVRRYAIVPPSNLADTNPFQVFDRNSKRRQRDRVAGDVEASRTVDYLRDEVALRVVDRLLDIKRDFDTIVDLGSGCGHIAKHLDSDTVRKVIMCEMSVQVDRLVVDEERLPFEENSLEGVVSSMSLHWVNDLPGEQILNRRFGGGGGESYTLRPRYSTLVYILFSRSDSPCSLGALIQIHRALKPDGMFIGALLGGDTLFELRTSLQLAELEREGGISPRVSPLTDTRDLGSLLSRAGFTLTTVDIDEIAVNYPSALELMQDLRAMGESNAVLNRRSFLKRDTLLAAAAIYKELHGNPDGTIPATFQILYMIGWKPSPLTPAPKKRGSASKSLKDALVSEGEATSADGVKKA